MKHAGIAMTNIGLFILAGYLLYFLFLHVGLVEETEQERLFETPLILMIGFLAGGISLRLTAFFKERSSRAPGYQRPEMPEESVRQVWEEKARQIAGRSKDKIDAVLTPVKLSCFSFLIAYWPHPQSRRWVIRSESHNSLSAYTIDAGTIQFLGKVEISTNQFKELTTLLDCIGSAISALPVIDFNTTAGPPICNSPVVMSRTTVHLDWYNRDGILQSLQTSKGSTPHLTTLIDNLERYFERYRDCS